MAHLERLTQLEEKASPVLMSYRGYLNALADGVVLGQAAAGD